MNEEKTQSLMHKTISQAAFNQKPIVAVGELMEIWEAKTV